MRRTWTSRSWNSRAGRCMIKTTHSLYTRQDVAATLELEAVDFDEPRASRTKLNVQQNADQWHGSTDIASSTLMYRRRHRHKVTPSKSNRWYVLFGSVLPIVVVTPITNALTEFFTHELQCMSPNSPSLTVFHNYSTFLAFPPRSHEFWGACKPTASRAWVGTVDIFSISARSSSAPQAEYWGAGEFYEWRPTYLSTNWVWIGPSVGPSGDLPRLHRNILSIFGPSSHSSGTRLW